MRKQRRKFESSDDAVAYLEKRGKLKYWGRIGENYSVCLYTFVFEGIMYSLNVHDSGLVEIRDD